MTKSLTDRKCQPCEDGVEPLPASAARTLLRDVPGWELVGEADRVLDKPVKSGTAGVPRHADAAAIRRTVKCKDFMDAVGLIQRIAPIAEAEDHHPDLHLTNYRRLTIELSTHAIGGLSENDFILAAKIDQLLK